MEQKHNVIHLMLIITLLSFENRAIYCQAATLLPGQNNRTGPVTADTTLDNIENVGVYEDVSPMSWSITKPLYDIRQPPQDPITGRPVLVQLKAYADFVQAVNEEAGEIVVAFFLRAQWHDSRVRELSDILRHMPGYRKDMLPMSGELKKSVWVPDLYLPNARHADIPTIREPAESVTIYQKSIVAYSAFFVIALKCEMTYSDYPMDVQVCYLDVMSYKYSPAEMELQWHSQGLFGLTQIATKHFHVILSIPRGNASFIIENADGSKRHVIRLQIFMKRHLAFHLVQTYLPSTMLVIIGWLSLLVPLNYAYGRMVLSVTTLLVLVTIFVTNGQETPGVHEVKALDIWLFMCIIFVFSAIVDCIADLRFLSMVEKESQIAGEKKNTRRGNDGALRADDGSRRAEEGFLRDEEGSLRDEKGSLRAEEGARPNDKGSWQAEKGSPRADESARPADEGSQQAEEGFLRAEEGSLRAEEDAQSAEEGTARAAEGSLRTEEGSLQDEEGSRLAKEGARPAGEGSRQTEKGSLRADEGARPAEEGSLRTEEGSLRAGEGAQSAEEGVRLVYQRSPPADDVSLRTGSRFRGSNTPFRPEREVLIATPAVLKWLRIAVFLERSMTIVYPTLFILLVAIYWSVYLTSYNARTPESEM